jgi:GTPase Era involved in 16S rRNA processing
MSSEQFQLTHESIHSIGTRLLQYLLEIRSCRLNQGDDTKSLQSVEDDINKALTALKEQKYQVAVIAAMKAGKSTFLNAIIGADILASESEACTVCRTDIRPISAGAAPKLLEYRQEQRKAIEIPVENAEELRDKLLERTREIRATGNSDNVTRFEIQHPIEAISKLSSLSGFTLVDTPGPNEWESASFSTVALKQTALEALRTCNAILFILDYSSFKDNTNSELLQDLIEQRKEFLAQNTGKIYFILNKIDRKAQKDRAIEDVIADLRQALIGFGIPEPIIYSASAWQGLLAKLIQSKQATKDHKADFKNFFLARYIEEDEDGDPCIPKLIDIAPKALIDSGIATIEQSVIQTVVQNSGWNLLSDALAKLEKATKGIEDTLNTQISAWDMEIETLKQKVADYIKRADNSKSKVQDVKESVEQQKKILLNGFSQGISIFAQSAKANIQHEIDQIASSRSTKSPKIQPDNNAISLTNNIGGAVVEIGEAILELFPVLRGLRKIIRGSVKAGESLLNVLTKSVPEYISGDSSDPYKIRVKSKEDAKKIQETINQFCTPHIQSMWLDTQDKLIADGTSIRYQLVQKIQKDIQNISNELSEYIGQSLQVDININDIQFPEFEFKGIDAEIKKQQGVITATKPENRKNCCNSDYTVDVPTIDIDLHEISRLIQQKVDQQVQRNQYLLERVIEKQVSADFRNAECQINDYIKKFQDEFDSLQKERETRESEKMEIRATLEAQKANLNEYLNELAPLRVSLDSWKPNQIPIMLG